MLFANFQYWTTKMLFNLLWLNYINLKIEKITNKVNQYQIEIAK